METIQPITVNVNINLSDYDCLPRIELNLKMAEAIIREKYNRLKFMNKINIDNIYKQKKGTNHIYVIFSYDLIFGTVGSDIFLHGITDLFII